jgi:hypothetical protein
LGRTVSPYRADLPQFIITVPFLVNHDKSSHATSTPPDSPRPTRGRPASAPPCMSNTQKLSATYPSRTPRVSHASSSTRAPRALSLIPFTQKLLSLNSKPWRSSTTPPSIEGPPPRRSLAGGRRRLTLTSYTTSTSSSSLELGASQAFPSIPFPFLKLQARRTSSSFTKPSTSS